MVPFLLSEWEKPEKKRKSFQFLKNFFRNFSQFAPVLRDSPVGEPERIGGKTKNFLNSEKLFSEL